MEITIVLFLLMVAVVFFIIELFLIPGISVAGIAGTLFMGGAIYYAYTNVGSMAGHLTLAGGLILLAVAIWIFIRSKALEKMALKTEIDGKNDPMHGMNIQIGDTGVTSSRMAPMGKVKINGYVVEAKSNDDFIDAGVAVKVIEIMKTNILIERVEE
jgi:membrane-bound ClpP family serine protease